jgi:hypothetical protein
MRWGKRVCLSLFFPWIQSVTGSKSYRSIVTPSSTAQRIECTVLFS